jgi:GntR family transcriptional regulator
MITTSDSRSKVLEIIEINPNSITPHYQQLEDQLLEAVACGDLMPGEPLPSEREFSKSLGISRMTVRRALTDLEAQGRLQSRVGKGWYAGPAKIEQKLQQLSGFSADMRSNDLDVKSKVIEFKAEPADPTMAQQLEIAPGDLVYHLDRIRLINGHPVGLEYPRVPARLCPGMEQFDFSKDSLYRVMTEEYGITLDRARQTIEATLVNWHEAKLLVVDPGAPAIRGKRTVFDPEGTIVEVSKAVYRGDRYKYQFELRQDSNAGSIFQ